MAANILRNSLRGMLRMTSLSVRTASSNTFLTVANAGVKSFVCKTLPTSIANCRFYSSEVKFTNAQIEEKVLEILNGFDRIKENPASPKVTLQSHLIKDLGLDSLDHVEIIVQLEDTFGYEIPDSEYEKLYTPKEIVNYIQKRVEQI